MNNTKKITLSAGIFGVLAAFFLFPMFYHFAPMGLNIPVTLAVLYGVIFVAMRGSIDLRNQNNWILLIPIAALAAEFVLYNNGLLRFLNLVMLALLVSVQIWLMTAGEGTILTRGRAFSCFGTMLFFRPFHRIGTFYGGIISAENRSARKNLGGILIGLAVAVPVLAVMLWLLTSGDMIFGKMVENVMTWESIAKSIVFLLLLGAFFTFSGSFLTSLRTWKFAPSARAPREVKLNVLAVMIVTVALSILMMIFSVVQLVYLTGMKELPAGFSYSEYAREGFFQLCAAAAIIFAVIAFCSRFTRHTEGKLRIVLNGIYTLLAVSILVLLVSSFARMVMYEQVYRFTRLRLYTQGFMILLGVVTVFVVIKIWNLRFRLVKFVSAAVVIALILLGYFNVDGFIARDAVEYARRTGSEVDYEYLSSLSADALAEYGSELTIRDIDRAVPSVDPDDREGEYEKIEAEWERYYRAVNTQWNLRGQVKRMEKGDWRTWNRNLEKAEEELPGTLRRFLLNQIHSEESVW